MADLADQQRRVGRFMLCVAWATLGSSLPCSRPACAATRLSQSSSAAQSAAGQSAAGQGAAGQSAAGPGAAQPEPELLPWHRRGKSEGQPARCWEWYELAGLDASQWRAFRDGEPWTEDLQEPLIKVLFRLPQIEAEDIVRWRRQESLDQVLADPESHRLDVLPLRGRLKKIVRRPVIPELARNYDINEYYEAEVSDEQGRLLLVHLRQAPEVWLRAASLDEPVEFDGLFLQRLTDSPAAPSGAAFAAQRLVWKPQQANPELGVSQSMVRLATLGVDAANLEILRKRDRKGLNELDREPFYQWMRAAKLAAQVDPAAVQASPQPLDLAELMSKTSLHHGDYLRFGFNIRRVTRVVVEDPEIVRHYGVSQYYQLDGFVPLGDLVIRLGADSQHASTVFQERFPASVVVAELPVSIKSEAENVAAGRSQAETLNRNVEVDAFFFKVWSYKTEYVQQNNPSQLQISPMFMGVHIRILSTRKATSPWWGALAGGLFVAAVAAIWWAMWRSSRTASSRRGRPGDEPPQKFIPPRKPEA